MQELQASDRKASGVSLTEATILCGALAVRSRFRALLFPLLVITIISSLWAVGRAQEMEDEIRSGVGPSPRWTALVDYAYPSAE